MSHRRIAPLAAVTAAGLLATLSACGTEDSSGEADAATGTKKVTLTVATFNQFGYEDLLPEYQKLNPNVTINHKKAATSNDARDNFFTRLAAGSGLADVEAVEVDWLAEMMQYSDKFNDLKSDERQGPLARLEGRRRHRRQRPPHRLRHRHRPRGDLLPLRPLRGGRAADRPRGGRQAPRQRAGRATSRSAASSRPSPSVPWFDSIGATYQGMINQVETTYENKDDGSIIATDNPDVKKTYDAVLKAGGRRLSAHSQQWSDDWVASFRRTASRRCSARAGCSASSRATPRASRAGTSPTSSPAAAATGAVRT